MLQHHLFALGAHIGHLRVEASQCLSNYLLGIRGFFLVIDLRKTVSMIKSAILFIERIVRSFGHALFCLSNITNVNAHIRLYLSTIVTGRNQSFSHIR